MQMCNRLWPISALLVLSAVDCQFSSSDVPSPEFSFAPGTITVRVPKVHDTMRLAAIHFSLNQPVIGTEPGNFNKDLSLQDNDFFTHTFPAQWKADDVIHYWIYVIVNGLGYQLLGQQYQIPKTAENSSQKQSRDHSNPSTFEAPSPHFNFLPGIIHITIPAPSNVTLAAIHMNLNEPLPGVEAGTYNIDLPKKGANFSETVRVPWKPGDVIHYWTYFIYRGLGYEKLSQKFHIGKEIINTITGDFSTATSGSPTGPTTDSPTRPPTVITPSCQSLVETNMLPSVCGNRDQQLLDVLLAGTERVKVVKGEEAATGEFPWQAELEIESNGRYVHHCGGVIVSDRIVITAAHCLTKARKKLQVKVGQHDRRVSDEPGEQIFFIQSVVEHANFQLDRSRGYLNDIAILLLRRNGNKGIVFSPFVRPICLPSCSLVLNYTTTCFVSGWGKPEALLSDSVESASPVLRGARLAPVSADYCSSAEVYGSRFDKERHLCAGFIRGGADACGGDSGGPLACIVSPNRWVMAGVVSWGGECGAAVHPGVYTKVTHFVDWICRSIQFLLETSV